MPPLKGPHMRLAPVVVAFCASLLLATACPAAADSVVFSRDNNIWLSNSDGSGQYQVTLDGTPSSPYSSPSQADDGTIVALRTPPGGRAQIWRMTQSGGSSIRRSTRPRQAPVRSMLASRRGNLVATGS